MKRTITVLGCGSSGGVPRVSSAGWGVCDPDNPKNRRRRCSILIEQKGEAGQTFALIDTSPDLREQLLDARPSHIDAVLYTHEHADHTHGIDDLRPMVIDMQRRISIFGSGQTLGLLRQRFGYCFSTPPGSSYPPILEDHLMMPGETIGIGGLGGRIDFMPFQLDHGDIESFGFRFGNVAYAPDVSEIPAHSLDMLRGLDLLILDALRDKPHPSHLTVQEALDYIAELRPKRAVLTNLHTDLDYEALKKRLPAGVEPAFDGMVLAA